MAATIVVAATVALWLAAAGPGVRAVTDQMLKVACDDMTPRHEGFKANSSGPNPYRLLVAPTVVPGELVNVTLFSVDGRTPFKGFMVQARDDSGYVLGTFLPDCSSDGGNKSHHMITCSNGYQPYVSTTVVRPWGGDGVRGSRYGLRSTERVPPSSKKERCPAQPGAIRGQSKYRHAILFSFKCFHSDSNGDSKKNYDP